MNAVLQSIPIAAEQVCTANTSIEDQVAAKTNIFFCHIQGTVTLCMPRRISHFKFTRAEFEDLSVSKINRGLWTRVNVKAKDRTATTRPPEDMVFGVKCHMWKRIQRIRNRRRTADMIEMRVRIPKMTELTVSMTP